jgi:hypothetical protein
MDLVGLDDCTGSAVDLVRATLERDLEQMRKNKSNSLKTTDGQDTARYLGVEGRPFELKDAPIAVQFFALQASNETKVGLLGMRDLQYFCVNHKLPERAPRKTSSGN